jgi:hypothetical protein
MLFILWQKAYLSQPTTSLPRHYKKVKIFAMKKNCIVFLFTLALATIACNKNNDTLEAATITQRDFSYCACCGGFFIEIDGVQRRFETIPSSSTIDLQTITLPLEVKVRWQEKQERCKDDLIDILEMVPN